MNALRWYKRSIISLGSTPLQRKLLDYNFSRWYINCPRNNFVPLENIVVASDLEFANRQKTADFQTDIILAKSDELYKQYLIFTQNESSRFIGKRPMAITTFQKNRLLKLYCGSETDLTYDIEQLLTLYDILGINNLQLSIPPIYNGIELFGSPLNTHNDTYCSPFTIEKKFGSLGCFWEYSPHKEGIYLCNPPFDEQFIEKMSIKLVQDLKKTQHDIIVIVTIPMWDSTSQKTVGIHDYGMNFIGLEKLKESDFIREHVLLNKNCFKYWNYYTNEKISVCWTHLLILSNMEDMKYRENFNLTKFLALWKKFSECKN